MIPKVTIYVNSVQLFVVLVSYVDYIVNLELCMALLQLLRIADNQVKTTICQQVYMHLHVNITISMFMLTMTM